MVHCFRDRSKDIFYNYFDWVLFEFYDLVKVESSEIDLIKECYFPEFIHNFEVGDFRQFLIGVVNEFFYWWSECVIFAEWRIFIFNFLFFLLHDYFAPRGNRLGFVGFPCVHLWLALHFDVYSLVLDAEVEVPLFDFWLLIVCWLTECGDVFQESFLNFLDSFIFVVFVILELTIDFESLILLRLEGTKIKIWLSWVLSESLLLLLAHSEIQHSTCSCCLLLGLLSE